MVPEKASFRRVVSESYAALTSQMRQQVERFDDTVGRKVTKAERNVAIFFSERSLWVCP